MNSRPTGLKGLPSENDMLPFPKIEKPEIIGYYSIDTNREFQNNAENLRYFRMPETYPLDLNAGYEFVKSSKSCVQDEGLEFLLAFIYHNKSELLFKTNSTAAKAVEDIDFICSRGSLRLMMNTPFEIHDDWSIVATKFKGNIYLFENEIPYKKEQRMNRSEEQAKMLSYGYKFEQYCMTSDPLEAPDTSIPVDESENFHVVFKTMISGMNVLYGAEVDGVLPDKNTVKTNVNNKTDLKALKLVELKSSIRPSHPKQEQMFIDKKCRNWWCQCFLVGIKDLMLGYRNNDGFVDEIKHMDVRNLPKIGEGLWSPSHCADFLLRLLQKIYEIMKEVNCPYTVYEFYFDRRSRIVSYRIYPGKSSLTFLPDWYIELLQ